MAITITFAKTSAGGAVSDAKIDGVVSITNAGSNIISLQGMVITEASTLGTSIRQPDFLVSNAAPGTFPTLAAGATGNYPFSVVCAVPNMPGASPQVANTYRATATPPAETVCRLNLFVQAYDAVAVAYVNNTASLQFPVAPAVAMSPAPQGGAAQFNTSGDAANWFFAFA